MTNTPCFTAMEATAPLCFSSSRREAATAAAMRKMRPTARRMRLAPKERLFLSGSDMGGISSPLRYAGIDACDDVDMIRQAFRIHNPAIGRTTENT
jgi:hypothetical protein